VFTPAPNDSHAAVALSGSLYCVFIPKLTSAALAHSLYAKDCVGIVRYVARSNATPKLGMIFPVRDHCLLSYLTLAAHQG
jgi:hypothetical protein